MRNGIKCQNWDQIQTPITRAQSFFVRPGNNNSHTTFNFTYVTTQLTSVNTRISCILNFKRNNSSTLPCLDLSVRAMRVTKSVCEFAVESCVPIDGRWPEFALLMFMGAKFGLREKGTKEVTEFHFILDPR